MRKKKIQILLSAAAFLFFNGRNYAFRCAGAEDRADRTAGRP